MSWPTAQLITMQVARESPARAPHLTCGAFSVIFYMLDEVATWMELPFGDDVCDVDMAKYIRRVDKHTASLLATHLGKMVLNYDLYPETRLTDAAGSLIKHGGERGKDCKLYSDASTLQVHGRAETAEALVDAEHALSRASKDAAESVEHAAEAAKDAAGPKPRRTRQGPWLTPLRKRLGDPAARCRYLQSKEPRRTGIWVGIRSPHWLMMAMPWNQLEDNQVSYRLRCTQSRYSLMDPSTCENRGHVERLRVVFFVRACYGYGLPAACS